ncbi:EamA family transporter [Alphaproteobacteria bacterium KMM 3653]|uniref:EamA family transporter n=1 Tax=Harenicola maris TaxID=2841044 RepID=A0AAP2G9X0_9RHOB|nr:EamA family transporter [Harenicola maris]
MSDWIIALEGTEAGHHLAMVLALTAAFLHAVFGSLQKGRHDPWITRGVIDFWMVLLSAPFALFAVPWPQGGQWVLLLGVMAIHFVYKAGMALAYSRGAFTVVYPVVRGSGALFTVLGAWVFFGERFTVWQWSGVAVLCAGIFGLAGYNMRKVVVARETLLAALGLAVLTGVMTAIYTTYDAYVIRVMPDPFTFLAWFFFLSSIDFALIGAWRWRRAQSVPEAGRLVLRGALGAVIAFGSFGGVMLATRLGNVGEAAVMRETSTVFAAIIGWVVLKEAVGPRRLALMILIAAGAVIVEAGG